MAFNNNLFRKVSLERLSSPEQLDLLMQVTSPKGWVALLALCGLVVVAVGWGIFGSIPTKVKGTCILIRPSGVSEIVAAGEGRISDISVSVGDSVREGQMIARIEQRGSLVQIRNVESTLHELKAQEQNLKSLIAIGERQQSTFLIESEKNLNNRVATARSRLLTLEAKAQNQTQLLEQGLITKQALLATNLEHTNVQQEIDDIKNEIRQLGIRRIDLRKSNQRELTEIGIKVNQSSRHLASLLRSLKKSSLVYSPYSGRVLEIGISETDFVTAGMEILTIEQTGPSVNSLEARVYIGPHDGKKVHTNMDVQIAPSTVKSEEFGLMLGKVRTVSNFPSSTQSILRTLKNTKLVEVLAGGAPPIEVQVDLIPSSDTVSGYKWSSPRGPEQSIESGTLCSANITVKKQHPISLVIPMLQNYLDI